MRRGFKLLLSPLFLLRLRLRQRLLLLPSKSSPSLTTMRTGLKSQLKLVSGLFVFLFLFTLTSCSGELRKSELDESLRAVLNALDTALDFFDNHKNQLNLDAVIGSRIVEGQLFVLKRHLASSPDTIDQHDDSTTKLRVLPPDDVLSKIDDVQRKAQRVSDDSAPYIAKNQPEYYRRIGPIIQQGFWTHDYPTRDLDSSLLMQPLYQGEVMREADSDNCLTELFGTGEDTQKCRISRRCWKLMTSPGYRYYSLSHELFYLQIGESYGCFRGNFLHLTDDLSAGFCSNMLAEAESIADKNYPKDRRDLFMEQQALCGMMGYRQFFRTEWLQKMLGWQWKQQGCYGDHDPAPAGGSTGSSARVKREERQLPDGCECHLTAVAIGALGQYVRYLIEAMQ